MSTERQRRTVRMRRVAVLAAGAAWLAAWAVIGWFDPVPQGGEDISGPMGSLVYTAIFGMAAPFIVGCSAHLIVEAFKWATEPDET